jgi:hypothetical protein
MNLFFNHAPVSQFDCAANYPDKEFASPTRSTVPLLDALRKGATPSFLEKLLLEAGLSNEALDLHLEYQVKPFKGKGKASHTDLMVIQPGAPKRSIAIEAKWTEPRYETVSKWLGCGTSPENRRNVLGGWLESIAGHTGTRIDPGNCGDLVYQMVHRAASAVEASGAGGSPAMAYLIFKNVGEDSVKGEAPLEEYREDLRQFRTIIGNGERFPFFLISVPIRSTAAFASLSGLTKGHLSTVQSLRLALGKAMKPLFDFGEVRIEPL